MNSAPLQGSMQVIFLACIAAQLQAVSVRR